MLSSTEKMDVAGVDRAIGDDTAPEAAGALDIKCLDRSDELWALEHDWRRLQRRCGSDLTYFQSYDWCATWWASVGWRAQAAHGVQLQVLTARRNGELVVLWPLMIEKGPLGLQRLTLLGGELSQYGGVLTDGKRRGPAISRRAGST